MNSYNLVSTTVMIFMSITFVVDAVDTSINIDINCLLPKKLLLQLLLLLPWPSQNCCSFQLLLLLRRCVCCYRCHGKINYSQLQSWQELVSWWEAAHYTVLQRRCAEAGMHDLAGKQAASLLRYIGAIPADKAFYEAGGVPHPLASVSSLGAKQLRRSNIWALQLLVY